MKTKSIKKQNNKKVKSKRVGVKRGPYKKRAKKSTFVNILLKLILILCIIIAAYYFMLNFDDIFNIDQTTNTTNVYNNTNKPITFKDKYIGNLDYKKYPFLKEDLKDKGIELNDDDINYNARNIDNIVRGKDGWVFYIGANEKKILEGERFISAEWFMNSANMMDELKKICDEQGKEVYFLIVPMKELIYSEYLPDGFMEKQNDKDDLALFSQYTNEKED